MAENCSFRVKQQSLTQNLLNLYLVQHLVWFKVMVFNATFNNISVISWWQFYWWRKSVYPEKTTDLSQVTDIIGCMEYTSPWTGFELTTLYCQHLDIDVDCNLSWEIAANCTIKKNKFNIKMHVFYCWLPTNLGNKIIFTK